MITWESESNESLYKRCGVGPSAFGVKFGVVELLKKKYFEVVWSYGEQEE